MTSEVHVDNGLVEAVWWGHRLILIAVEFGPGFLILKIAGGGVTGRLKPDKSDSRLTAIRLLLMLNAVRRVFPVAGRS
jgi:hypothetical protein